MTAASSRVWDKKKWYCVDIGAAAALRSSVGAAAAVMPRADAARRASPRVTNVMCEPALARISSASRSRSNRSAGPDDSYVLADCACVLDNIASATEPAGRLSIPDRNQQIAALNHLLPCGPVR